MGWAARAASIPCSLCGAMASDLLAAPLLVGLGVVELSVDPHAVPSVKAALSRVTLADARAVAERALALATAEEVEALVREQLGPRMSDLLAAGG